MRAVWAALRQSLVRDLRTWKSAVQFKAMQQQKAALARFGDLGGLISYLDTLGGDLDDKDAIYVALVEVAHDGAPGEQATANALLFVGLWNGLDAIYLRRERLFPTPDDAVSELTHCFATVVHRAVLSRITRVAATLVKNTERTLLERRKQTRGERPVLVRLAGSARAAEEGDATPGLLHQVPTDDAEREAAGVLRWLEKVIGRDAELVLRVGVHGETERDAARALGLGEEAARKRYQRAIGRLREHLEKNDEPLSHFGRHLRVL